MQCDGVGFDTLSYRYFFSVSLVETFASPQPATVNIVSVLTSVVMVRCMIFPLSIMRVFNAGLSVSSVCQFMHRAD